MRGLSGQLYAIPARAHPRRWIQGGLPQSSLTIGFSLIAFYLVVCRYPSFEGLLGDPDGGYQLAGGMMILRGQHPFSAFQDIYGPLVFYSSALAQLIFPGRMIGEFLLCSVGYTLAYTLFFLIQKRLLRSTAAAFLFGLVILLLIPRHYKYYIVLIPLFSLSALLHYIRQPGQGRLALSGFALTLTGLFRPDFGVYSVVAGVAAIAARPIPGYTRTRSVGLLLLCVLGWASPWLVWASFTGSIGSYLRSSTLGAALSAEGMALPFPPLVFSGVDFTVVAKALAFHAFPFAPFLVAGWLALRRHKLAEPEKVAIIVVITFSQLSIIQLLHRSDWGHFLQATTMAHIGLGWVICDSARVVFGRSKQGNRILAATFGSIAASLLLLAASAGWSDAISSLKSPDRLLTKIQAFVVPNEQQIRALAASDHAGMNARLVKYLRDNHASAHSLAVLPANPQIVYFSDLPLGGGLLGMLPGYFSSSADQQAFTRRLRTDRTDLVVVETGIIYDDRNDRSFELFAAQTMSAIERDYRVIATFERFRVYRFHGPE